MSKLSSASERSSQRTSGVDMDFPSIDLTPSSPPDPQGSAATYTTELIKATDGSPMEGETDI